MVRGLFFYLKMPESLIILSRWRIIRNYRFPSPNQCWINFRSRRQRYLIQRYNNNVQFKCEICGTSAGYQDVWKLMQLGMEGTNTQ